MFEIMPETLIAIGISLLFGFAAFAAVVSATTSTMQGITRGKQILAELAELDAYAAASVSRSGPVRQAASSPLRQRSGAHA